jgi:hypothetical protein
MVIFEVLNFSLLDLQENPASETIKEEIFYYIIQNTIGYYLN